MSPHDCDLGVVGSLLVVIPIVPVPGDVIPEGDLLKLLLEGGAEIKQGGANGIVSLEIDGIFPGGADEVMLGIIAKYENILPGRRK